MYEMLSSGIHRAKSDIQDRRQHAEEADIYRDLRKIVQSAIAKFEATVDKTVPSLNSTMLKLFLESPEAESIVRQIFSDELSDKESQEPIKQLREEFGLLLARYVSAPQDQVAEASDAIFDALLSCCNQLFNISVSKGILLAHEWKSIARFRLIQDELVAIKAALEFNRTKAPDLHTVLSFEQDYRRLVRSRNKQITIQQYDRVRRVDLNRIFVAPNLLPPKYEQFGPLPLLDFMSRIYRVVVLGDPGGGKSTLAQKICLELSANYDKRRVGNRRLTPVLVVMREYSASKKQSNTSILDYIRIEANSSYQLPAASNEIFEYLLHNGHLLVVFDGLDEILDTSERKEITSRVESFCDMYPSVPVLVTSREVGYELAPLDRERFETYHIASFDSEQVRDYAEKWFAFNSSPGKGDYKKESRDFLRESRLVGDVRSNPLMLALMCTLYRGTGFIPKNRPEVYKKCSEMMFEIWDSRRGIMSQPASLSGPHNLLSHLAHWVYSNPALLSGVSERELTRAASDYLLDRTFETREDSERAAKEFVKFCKGRAWVFTDAGTTRRGENLFKFTHNTFLEYFTAVYITRNNIEPTKLWEFLGPKIAQRSWDVVAQIAFQIVCDEVEGASESLLTFLLKDSAKDSSAAPSYLSFGIRCLSFVQASPNLVRKITKATVHELVENKVYFDRTPSPRTHSESEPVQEFVRAIRSTAAEYRGFVTDTFESEVVSYISGSNIERAARATDLTRLLAEQAGYYSYDSAESAADSENLEGWRRLRLSILEKTKKRQLELAQNNFYIFRTSPFYESGFIPQLCKIYGPDYLYEPTTELIRSDYGVPPLASLIAEAIMYSDHPRRKEFLQVASDVGTTILNMSQPSFSHPPRFRQTFGWFPHRHYHDARTRSEAAKTLLISEPQSFFGLWILFAASCEVYTAKDYESLSQMAKEFSIFAPVAEVIMARRTRQTPEWVLQALRRSGLPPAEENLIRKWVSGDLNFCGRSAT
jgi:hypothetical protein